MADEAKRSTDPEGTMDTVPPPKGAKDAYSADTRVGTLPEHVLAAMRDHETDAALAARTTSGTRAAQRPSLAAPRVPSFPATPPPLPPGASRPPPVAPAGAPPLPWSRLATPRPMRAASPASPRESLPPASPLAPLALTPLDGWLASPPPMSIQPPPVSLPPPAMQAPEEPAIPRLSWPPSLSRITPLPPATRDLVRSIVVVAVFALLGALVAVAITLAGH